MAIAFLLEIPGGTKEQYDQITQGIGLTGSQLAPGQLVHFAGPVEGGWQVVNVWESQEAAEKWMNEKINPAREKAGSPEPVVKVFPVHRLAK